MKTIPLAEWQTIISVEVRLETKSWGSYTPRIWAPLRRLCLRRHIQKQAAGSGVQGMMSTPLVDERRYATYTQRLIYRIARIIRPLAQ